MSYIADIEAITYKGMIDLNRIFDYTISYPKIAHPLSVKKMELKAKYIAIIYYLTEKHASNDTAVHFRLRSLMDILGVTDSMIDIPKSKSFEAYVASITRTRFSPFRFFTYRYILLYDCLFVLAIGNEELGNTICKELKLGLNKRYHSSLDNMKSKMYKEMIDFSDGKLISKELYDTWVSVRNYIRTQRRWITFSATMSAGKSTLINSIIGKQIAQTKKAACTANIMTISCAPLKTDSLSIQLSDSVKNLSAADNIAHMTKGLEVPTDICTYFLSPLTQRKITLIDTPGVNSSQNPKHKEITRLELSSNRTDILVYVIPVESYGSDDDFNHLVYIKKKVNYSRILFVINMMDTCDTEEDSVAEIVSNLREHLISIGYNQPVICPMSARAGGLIKQALYGRLESENDKKQCITLKNTFLNEELSLSHYYPEVQRKPFVNDLSWLSDDHDLIWKAFINTGLPGFEELLCRISEEE